MKFRINRIVIVVSFVSLSMSAYASPCVSGTLASVIGTTCSIGDKNFTFGPFAYSTGNETGSGAGPAAGDVTFTPNPISNNPGFTLTGHFSDSRGPGTANNQNLDFNVSTISGLPLINSITTTMGGGLAVGLDAFAVVEDAANGQFPAAMLSNTGDLGPGIVMPIDTVTFAASAGFFNHVSLTQEIVDSGTSASFLSASFNFGTQVPCGCAKIGAYVDPDGGPVTADNPVPSPGGKYRVTTRLDGAIMNLTVTNVKSGATFKPAPPAGVHWGFSPDDDRFLYHYVQGNVDNLFVYDLSVSPAVNVAQLVPATPPTRFQFSRSGRYLFVASMTGPSHSKFEIYQVAGVTIQTPVYQSEFDFQTVPGVAGDSFGATSSGFSPDKPESTFVYAYGNGQTSVQWNIVNLAKNPSVPKGQLVHSETVFAPAFWQFSPCADLIGIVKQPNTNQVEVQLFSTSDGSLVPGSDKSFPFAATVFSSTLASQIVTVGSQPVVLANNIQCGSTNTPAGSNVVVWTGTPGSGTVVTFAGVSQAGTTTQSSSSSGPAPPPFFGQGYPPTYYDVSTTAQFVGPASVCLDYNGILFANPAGPRLFHFENGAWVDRTTSVDTANHIVCGSVASLSPFALFESVVPADVNGDGQVDCTDVTIVKVSFGKNFHIGYDPRADVNGDGVVDIRDLAFVAQRLPAGTRCP